MLKELRLQKKLQAKAVADAIGMSESYYSRVENGHVELPTKYYKPMARVLKVAVKELVKIRVQAFEQRLLQEANNA